MIANVQLSPRRHTRTDPACTEHRAPRTRFARWRYDRKRGVSCRACGYLRLVQLRYRLLGGTGTVTYRQSRTRAAARELRLALMLSVAALPGSIVGIAVLVAAAAVALLTLFF